MHSSTGIWTYALLALMMVSCVQSHCDTAESQDDCITLFKLFQQALVNPSRHNLFRLQVVFYPLSRSTPALVKITYNLNITCDPRFGESCLCNRGKDKYVFGWTDRRLYRTFHPAVINLLRFQLPFWILEVAEDALTDYLDVDALLWDGDNQLPSVNISLDVKLFPENFTSNCPPGGDLIQLALEEVNHWVRL